MHFSRYNPKYTPAAFLVNVPEWGIFRKSGYGKFCPIYLRKSCSKSERKLYQNRTISQNKRRLFVPINLIFNRLYNWHFSY
ncbi:MAG: hypothetical protein AVDCRST_MAG95-1413 [uncultured Adhaeribacter sp.]|uniref:Uncharacterized protein n=1 Tax=uncultured Adhaeribacter sp. TaxID=448109 RepID=A0A6J4I513_9BACT|nr:MAG: hypothetical protein AVDCRST_MAG95-1413 [uncultured Adhaeribacter sp.]